VSFICQQVKVISYLLCSVAKELEEFCAIIEDVGDWVTRKGKLLKTGQKTDVSNLQELVT